MARQMTFHVDEETWTNFNRVRMLLAQRSGLTMVPSQRQALKWLLSIVPFAELEAAVGLQQTNLNPEEVMLHPLRVEMPDGRVFEAFVDDHGKVDNATINGKVANATELADVAAFVATLQPKEPHLG